jgi:hypothetical protein
VLLNFRDGFTVPIFQARANLVAIIRLLPQRGGGRRIQMTSTRCMPAGRSRSAIGSRALRSDEVAAHQMVRALDVTEPLCPSSPWVVTGA